MTRAGEARLEVQTAPLADAAARDAYAALAATSPQRTPFAGLAFADAVCRVFGLTGRIALGRGARQAGSTTSGEAQIGTVLFEKRTGPFRQIVVPPLAPYTGPLLAGEIGLGSAATVRAFLGAVRKGYHAVAFHLAPGTADVRPFTWAGFTATPLYTYLGDPGTESPYVRKMVRENGPVRADGSTRETGTATYLDAGAAADVASAMARAFARDEAPLPVTEAQAEALVRALVAAGVARIVVAEKQGARVGAVCTLADDRTGHFWLGAGEPGPAMLLLMAATARSLVQTGQRRFDLVGANMERVSVFKRRVGLPLVGSYRVAWTGSRLLRLRAALRRSS